MNKINKTNSDGAVTPLLFDIHATAQRLCMAPVSVRKLIRQGRLKRLGDFRKILISENELQRFAAQ
ncbi:MAG TPA: hypothetical protein VIK28_03055 [Sedimentisphaerales bacterium]